MCDTCSCSTELVDLVKRFEAMVAGETDPRIVQRLRSALDDLTLRARGSCQDDVIWADEPTLVPTAADGRRS
jgi:hypothetical protein